MIIALGLVSCGSYYISADLVNAQPATDQFNDFVAVLHPAETTMPERLELVISSTPRGIQGDRPILSYSVLTCESIPFVELF